jgi:hypothetical protein
MKKKNDKGLDNDMWLAQVILSPYEADSEGHFPSSELYLLHVHITPYC